MNGFDGLDGNVSLLFRKLSLTVCLDLVKRSHKAHQTHGPRISGPIPTGPPGRGSPPRGRKVLHTVTAPRWAPGMRPLPVAALPPSRAFYAPLWPQRRPSEARA